MCIYILISQFLLIREALWYSTIHTQTQLQAGYISIFSLSLSRAVCLSVSLCLALFLRLVVGAPVANSTSSPSVKSPGAIYRCGISTEHRRCHQMQSGVVLCVTDCVGPPHWSQTGLAERCLHMFRVYFQANVLHLCQKCLHCKNVRRGKDKNGLRKFACG